MKQIKVLVCDDSALMRRSLKKIIESDPHLKVVGTARDGEDSVAKARELLPDVITMDVLMPGMDGITALQLICEENIAPVIMVSYYTQEGAESTFEALALGAFDFVPKPEGTISDMAAVHHDIVDKIRAAARPGVVRRLTGKADKRSRSHVQRLGPFPRDTGRNTGRTGFRAVAIGISTGGPKTLFDVLPRLPADLNAAVFLVQHMPPRFITSYTRRIAAACAMKCYETEAGMDAEAGCIYVARGGSHLTLYQKTDGRIMIRSPRKPRDRFMPSVNIMMRSVLSVFGQDTVGVLMTGMGDDGALALKEIRTKGGITIAESEESAIVFGMPREAIELGAASVIAPCWEIAEEIIRAVSS
ncbi:MAG: chemotaxis response regulator protein-glutamate methylesterase [Desulfococcaceae bacterium]|jgi:two-component system chemotaxis response regulator CheB|nr:chemotaxis response regulator protein-glutamate methylesterase [Desulfococcaceae bacterium]